MTRSPIPIIRAHLGRIQIVLPPGWTEHDLERWLEKDSELYRTDREAWDELHAEGDADHDSWSAIVIVTSASRCIGGSDDD